MIILTHARLIRLASLLLALLCFICAPGYSAGLFDGLLPTPTPSPVPAPTPEATPIAVTGGDLQTALAGVFDSMTVSVVNGSTVLTISGISYMDCIAALQQMDRLYLFLPNQSQPPF